jgi:tRNA-Thr(GGU) m(6)t(6)A37 methyltransferase TsaA
MAPGMMPVPAEHRSSKKRIIFSTVSILLALVIYTFGAPMQSPEKKEFTVHPVGWINKQGSDTTIEITSEYQDALLGLDEVSHVWVLWWFDRNDTPKKRAVLQVHPQGNPRNPLTGVFATRSPERPNLIGMSLCKIRTLQRNTIQIESIDALDGTPVLDLKPYIPSSDGAESATVPSWLR